MASLTTYILVSGVEDPDEVTNHQAVEERDLEIHTPAEPEADVVTLTFVRSSPLEEAEDLGVAARAFSTAFPSAVVQMCVVEERFDQVERVRTVLYQDGTEAGEIEHGYVFNIGGE
jgi:hypothetical protein